MFRSMLCAAALAVAPLALMADGVPAPEGAKVYFINIADGDTVQSPVTVRFGLSGMGVAPAGIDKDNTGHHHILIDRAPFGEGAEDGEFANYGIPGDDNHRHFGGGQTEVMLGLDPGTHTLQLVLGDMNHIPHDPPVVSEQITITVE
ncbi:protein of unknown function [Mameliella alba]|uniref:DUF4399 domain-containing protein n=1 Tax=Mameliella alba TaxID=561184 RepID=UPI00088295F9|nr:rod shape-determining protein RodA [Mameliella alba]PTR38746.1 uncharacterized protein DUF4399 [Mameliella alba]GGF69127.1 hypothetical protein GCM10011319_32260 [Mameliella alba]SDD41035.1 protein of unknown function [Mameliella alba]